MPDDKNPTSGGEPGADSAATSTPEPDSRTGAESTPSTPSPSVEELQDRIRRLEANVSGTTQEWKRERAERERLQADLSRVQASIPQPPAQPPAIEPEFTTLARKLTSAVYDGKEDVVAQTLSEVAQRPMAQFNQMMQTAGLQAAKQQALNQYLEDFGVKPGTPTYKLAQKRLGEAATDRRYAFVADNPVALTAIIVNEVRADQAVSRKTAEEEARSQAAEGAVTEGTTGGPVPGKPVEKPEKIYLNADEMKLIAYDVKHKGLSEEEAKKRYWAHMDPARKAARVQAGRAI